VGGWEEVLFRQHFVDDLGRGTAWIAPRYHETLAERCSRVLCWRKTVLDDLECMSGCLGKKETLTQGRDRRYSHSFARAMTRNHGEDCALEDRYMLLIGSGFVSREELVRFS
jgi:hypothetical protein